MSGDSLETLACEKAIGERFLIPEAQEVAPLKKLKRECRLAGEENESLPQRLVAVARRFESRAVRAREPAEGEKANGKSEETEEPGAKVDAKPHSQSPEAEERDENTQGGKARRETREVRAEGIAKKLLEVESLLKDAPRDASPVFCQPRRGVSVIAPPPDRAFLRGETTPHREVRKRGSVEAESPVRVSSPTSTPRLEKQRMSKEEKERERQEREEEREGGEAEEREREESDGREEDSETSHDEEEGLGALNRRRTTLSRVG